jgi:hypothetical protein
MDTAVSHEMSKALKFVINRKDEMRGLCLVGTGRKVLVEESTTIWIERPDKA